MPLPLTEAEARRATRWLMTNFGAELRRATEGSPVDPALLCGIAAKETGSLWLAFADRGVDPSVILGRAIGDASGDVPNTTRSAFPRDTAAFRAAFGDAFADMLIAEANASRALRNLGPRDWVYKGYGIFQYDLQHVDEDEAFFRERQWYRFDACLERVMRELRRKIERTGELWAAVKAYNGSGPRAEEYRDHVRVLTGWAQDEIAALPQLTGAGRSRGGGITTRSIMAKAKANKKKAKAAAGKTRAQSLHIGLNSVDPKHYAGWSGDLMACEFDAEDMAAIAAAQGMKPTVLLTKKATRANVVKAVRAAAKALKPGDYFFISYSGHGGQIHDSSGDEPDAKDETWCLYDSEFIDDEVFNELSAFEDGVRIFVLSDSCHSGSVVRARVPETIAGAGRSKMMPPSVAMRTYTQNQKFYDKIQADLKKAADRARKSGTVDPDAALAQLHASGDGKLTAIAGAVKASVILISGCQDNQTSLDGDHNGAFTEQLLRVWDDGRFNDSRGDYVKFHATIKAAMPATQTPNFFTLGATATFARQKPFKV